MSVFRNDNTHNIYVKGDDGELVRIRPGRGVEADGDFAKRLKATNGVSSVTGNEAKAALSFAQPDESPNTQVGTLGQSAAEALAQASRAVVSAPLQVVVGDDQAPYGPDTGVVTTKQEVVKDSPELYRQFAEGEPVKEATVEPQPGTIEGQPGAEVHNEQLANRDAVEEFAKSLAEVGEAPPSDSDDE